MWGSYSPLESVGYIHEKVNHSENYVNPEAVYHTQGVERARKTAELWLRCEMQNRGLFQSHLNEVA